MYRYVLNRLRTTIDLSSITLRKSFACQNHLNQNENSHHVQKQKSLLDSQEIQFVPIKINKDGNFKRTYCKHPNNCNNILQAITWVITKFTILLLLF